jgi:hypothetical protein
MSVGLMGRAVAEMTMSAVKSSFHGFQLADLTTTRFGGAGTLFPGHNLSLELRVREIDALDVEWRPLSTCRDAKL